MPATPAEFGSQHLLGGLTAQGLQDEVRALLANDSSRTGQIFLLLKEGLSDLEVQHKLELGTAASIGHAKRDIRAVLDGWNPPGFGPALRALNLVRRLRRQPGASEPLQAFLAAREEELEVWLEGLKALEQVRVADAPNETIGTAIAGVYVWSIATYIELEQDGLVWFRIGQSLDVEARMNQHRANIKLPEPLLHLRTYTSNHVPPDVLETQFHRIVQSATHQQARVNNRDREWFLTSLDFLDQYAQDIGCEVLELGEG